MFEHNPTMQFIKPLTVPKRDLLDIELLQHKASFEFEPWAPAADQMSATKGMLFSSLISVPFWLLVGVFGYAVFRR